MAGDLNEFVKRHIDSSVKYRTELDHILKKYEERDNVREEDLETVIDLKHMHVVKEKNGAFKNFPEFGKSRNKKSKSHERPRVELDSNQNVTAAFDSKYFQDSEFDTLKDISHCVASFIQAEEDDVEPSDGETISSFSTESEENISHCVASFIHAEEDDVEPSDGETISSFSTESEESVYTDCLEDSPSSEHELSPRSNPAYSPQNKSGEDVDEDTQSENFDEIDGDRERRQIERDKMTNVQYQKNTQSSQVMLDTINQTYTVEQEESRSVTSSRTAKIDNHARRVQTDFLPFDEENLTESNGKTKHNKIQGASVFDDVKVDTLSVMNRHRNDFETIVNASPSRKQVHPAAFVQERHSSHAVDTQSIASLKNLYQGSTSTQQQPIGTPRSNKLLKDNLSKTPVHRASIDYKHLQSPANDLSPSQRKFGSPVTPKLETFRTPTHHKHAKLILTKQESPRGLDGRSSGLNRSNSTHVDSGFSTMHEDNSNVDNNSDVKEVSILSMKNLQTFNESFTQNTSFMNVTNWIKSPDRSISEITEKKEKINDWLENVNEVKVENDYGAENLLNIKSVDHIYSPDTHESKVEFVEVEHHMIPFSPGKKRSPFVPEPQKFVLRSPEEELNRSIENQNIREHFQSSASSIPQGRPVIKKCVRRLNAAQAFQELKDLNAGDLLMVDSQEDRSSIKSDNRTTRRYNTAGKRGINEIDRSPRTENLFAKIVSQDTSPFPRKYRKLQRNMPVSNRSDMVTQSEFQHVLRNEALSSYGAAVSLKDDYCNQEQFGYDASEQDRNSRRVVTDRNRHASGESRRHRVQSSVLNYGAPIVYNAPEHETRLVTDRDRHGSGESRRQTAQSSGLKYGAPTVYNAPEHEFRVVEDRCRHGSGESRRHRAQSSGLNSGSPTVYKHGHIRQRDEESPRFSQRYTSDRYDHLSSTQTAEKLTNSRRDHTTDILNHSTKRTLSLNNFPKSTHREVVDDIQDGRYVDYEEEYQHGLRERLLAQNILDDSDESSEEDDDTLQREVLFTSPRQKLPADRRHTMLSPRHRQTHIYTDNVWDENFKKSVNNTDRFVLNRDTKNHGAIPKDQTQLQGRHQYNTVPRTEIYRNTADGCPEINLESRYIASDWDTHPRIVKSKPFIPRDNQMTKTQTPLSNKRSNRQDGYSPSTSMAQLQLNTPSSRRADLNGVMNKQQLQNTPASNRRADPNGIVNRQQLQNTPTTNRRADPNILMNKQQLQNTPTSNRRADPQSMLNRQQLQNTPTSDRMVDPESVTAFQQKPRNCSLKQAAVTRFSLKSEDGMMNEQPQSAVRRSVPRVSETETILHPDVRPVSQSSTHSPSHASLKSIQDMDVNVFQHQMTESARARREDREDSLRRQVREFQDEDFQNYRAFKESSMVDIEPEDGRFISFDTLARYNKHINVKQGQFRDYNHIPAIDKEMMHVSVHEREVGHLVQSNSENDDTSTIYTDDLSIEDMKPYKQYYKKIVEKHGGHESEKENSVKNFSGHKQGRDVMNALADSPQPRMKKSLFAAKVPLTQLNAQKGNTRSLSNQQSLPQAQIYNPNSKFVPSNKSQNVRKESQVGTRKQTSVEQLKSASRKSVDPRLFLQSTPIKTLNRLQFNDTMSTIMGSDENATAEDDEIILLQD